MRYAAIIVGFLILAYLAYNNFIDVPREDDAAVEQQQPPPPAELTEPPPPVLDGEALQRVRTATRDSDSNVRWEAVQFLVQANDPKAGETLYFMLHRDSDPQIRRNIVGILESKRGPEVTKHLIQSLRDTDEEVRLAALRALGKVGDYSASPAISDAIRDTNERVRLEALKTLKELETTRRQQIEKAKLEHAEKMRQWEEEMKRRQEAP